MKKTIKLVSILAIFACLIFVFNSYSKNDTLNIIDKKKKIALIVKMNYGYHWGTIKMGADTAAREFNVNIDYNTPGDEQDIDKQIVLVEQALDSGIDALILAASDYKKLVKVTEKAYEKHIPVIIIDSEVATNKIHSYIATDNYAAGIKAGEKLLEIAGPKARIAVMSFVKGTGNAEQRVRGLADFISQHPEMQLVTTQYSLSDTKLAYSLTKQIILNHGKIDAIVALNSISSEGVAEAIEQMDLKGAVKIIAFDNTPKEIDFLEKGVIQAIITQNPFSMGYLGVKYALDAMNGKSIPKYTPTESKVIDINNMYLPENQKLLFPFVK